MDFDEEVVQDAEGGEQGMQNQGEMFLFGMNEKEVEESK